MDNVRIKLVALFIVAELYHELRIFKAQWQTSLLHKFTAMLVEIKLTESEYDKEHLKQELHQYVCSANRGIASLRLFGRVKAIYEVQAWYAHAEQLVPIQENLVLQGIASAGMGRETFGEDLIFAEVKERAHRVLGITQN
jgi:hypothetical protein